MVGNIFRASYLFSITKKVLSSLWFKLAIAVSVVFILGYFNRLDWQGLTVLRETWYWLLFAFLLMFPPYVIVSCRFMIILRSQGIFVSFFQALRWTMIGSFFDLAMPSSSGGDLIKAGYVMKHAKIGMRTTAVMAVTFDRILGLLGLFLLTAIVVVAGWEAVHNLRGSRSLLSASICVTIGILFVFRVLGARRLQNHPRLIRLVSQNTWGDNCKQFIGAFNQLRERPKYLVQSLSLSIINHLFWCVSLFCIAHAAGSHVSFIQGLIGFPIAIFGNIFGVAGGFGVGTAGFDLILSQWMGIANGALIGLIFQALAALSRLAGLPFYLMNYSHGDRFSEPKLEMPSQ